MSEEQELDNLDTSYARKAGPLAPDQRAKKQEKFLKMYRETANIKYSCAYAGVNRQTFYDWRDHDAEFAARLPDANEDANDTLEFAAHDRAVNGVVSYVVSQGKLVYGPDNKPLVERKYSDSLLTLLLKARLPAKYKEQKQLEVSGPDGGPIQHVEVYKVRLPDNGRDSVEKGGDA